MKNIQLFRKLQLFTLFLFASIVCFSQAVQQWERVYNGPGDGRDIVRSMAVDSAGNVYITGSSLGRGTGDDYATVKYDSEGNQLWARRYNGPGNDEDKALSLAVDNLGYVYVTGYSMGKGTGYEYATIKYDRAGNEVWVRRHNGDYDYDAHDGGEVVTVDTLGNVYVMGLDATVKYGRNGNEVFVLKHSDMKFSIAVDDSENIYVTGNNFVTTKYDRSGNKLWETPALENFIAASVAIDRLGNVYVIGADFLDYVSKKYDAAGNELWVKRFTGVGNGLEFNTPSFTLDASGNLYLTGYRVDKGHYGDFVTIKYDKMGTQIWARGYNNPERGWGHWPSIAVDGCGNVYVAATSVPPYNTRKPKMFFIKYDKSGNQLWEKTYSYGVNIGLALDYFGNIYVTANIQGHGSDYLTIKYVETKPLTISLSIPYNIVKYASPARIKLNATATDLAGRITKVRFYNGTTLLHTETVSPYGFLWDNVPLGNYTLTAKAYDNSGNVATSNAINVSVVDENVPPVVNIASPVNDTTYTGPATIHLVAKAKDPNDRISKVELYNGTSILRTEYIYPYTYDWTNVQPGTYTIKAKAYDDKGLSATSEAVTFTVAETVAANRRSIFSNDKNNIPGMRLTPNPTKNSLNIYTSGLEQNKPLTISVISATGVVMKTIHAKFLNQMVQLNVSALERGVYIVKAASGKQVVYKQFVKL
ncbi:SBBP repeat-containing protein [Segetibacter koreensis]|uniref:SBBP repeat-containing protein n=1 Tax=Segetibacter koreensis TaxID=398037 RepID=UPI00035D33AD|nr:SBBP repeat-containing protein [Segetibacter koreensis]